MSSESERRKDPVVRYLHGKILELQEKIDDYAEKTKKFDEDLKSLKREDQ